MWTHRNIQRDPDRDLKRKKMETFRPFGKRENEMKLGSVLKKDAQAQGPQTPVSMVFLSPVLPITSSPSTR